ncbi:hypothetical protein DMW62_08140 [Serratia marcescens]|uniref:Uncharacterized protein n=1 Tax=Serratia marcescens TaxID=615 RepID=A0ABX5NIY9_SERMA|nr:hypothetical protein C3F38_10075 [Serratia sp. SSNIH1]POU56860.1 hypothetical protein C3401_00010 [Serratia sp. SSNIH4]POW42098.1 hypothetical protein C3396_02990 [Serratia sp. SSNIH5]POW43717.1 hypothetical protein C3414_00010 [Serratia sp. SSNIH2]POW63865.1 hypothetical protein C3403_01955 [Serratia sp. SSNIH3]PXZ99028.1 hypothetical protein CW300_03225 [Serratia marcescens]
MHQHTIRLIYPSYFKLLECWLSSFTPVTYWCKLPGTHCVAASKQLELFWVYITNSCRILAYMKFIKVIL